MLSSSPCFPPIEWTEWGAWSECSASCDGGQRNRTRVCEGAVGECAGEAGQHEACNTKPCRGETQIFFLAIANTADT